MKFTEEHEWLRVEGDEIVVGITIHAAEQLGDVVFVELPDEGTTVSKDDEGKARCPAGASGGDFIPFGRGALRHGFQTDRIFAV